VKAHSPSYQENW